MHIKSSGEHHGHTHAHGDRKAHVHGDDSAHTFTDTGSTILTVRAVAGLSGDMMLAGMARMAGVTQDELDAMTLTLGVTALEKCVAIEPRSIHGISGWGCHIHLPHEHAHRTLIDILAIIDASSLSLRAATLAKETFSLLAKAEGAVHGTEPSAVTFHEVGALDSILDICMVCALFDRIDPSAFVCSPLPLADGGVECAHGWIPTPAPAVLQLLQGVPVCSFAGRGETVTPTAIALLRALGAVFAPWPAMRIDNQALVYGTKVFDNAPNGSIWALGPGL